jgi:hypothetical protein
VDDIEDIVDLVGGPAAMGRTMAGRAAGTQWRGSPHKASVTPRFPASEAPCFARQVVEHAAERGEAERKPRCIDRIVRRGRGRDGKRIAEAGKGDARNPAPRQSALLEPAQRIEKREAWVKGR